MAPRLAYYTYTIALACNSQIAKDFEERFIPLFAVLCELRKHPLKYFFKDGLLCLFQSPSHPNERLLMLASRSTQVLRRRLATSTTPAQLPRRTRHLVRKVLFGVTAAATVVYSSSVALSQYDRRYREVLEHNVPLVKNLNYLYQTYRENPREYSQIYKEDLKAYLIGVLSGERISNGEPRKRLEFKAITVQNSESEMHEVLQLLNRLILRLNDQKLILPESQEHDVVQLYQKLATTLKALDEEYAQVVSKGVIQRSSDVIDALTDEYVKSFKTKEETLQAQYQKEFANFKSHIEKEMQANLDNKVKANEEAMMAKHANEMALLSVTQVKQFNKIIREAVDSERNGRLANLSKLDDKIALFNESLDKTSKILLKNESIKQLTTTIEDLRHKLASNEFTSFKIDSEIAKLKHLIEFVDPKPKPCCVKDNKSNGQSSILHLSLDFLEGLSGSTILSNDQVFNRWCLLEQDFKTASLLPSNPGLFSHMVSRLFSKLLITKKGDSPRAIDLDSIYARVEYNLRLGNLSEAVEQVVALRGWPHAICDDWIKDARKKLEIMTLVDLLDAEIKTL